MEPVLGEERVEAADATRQLASGVRGAPQVLGELDLLHRAVPADELELEIGAVDSCEQLLDPPVERARERRRHDLHPDRRAEALQRLGEGTGRRRRGRERAGRGGRAPERLRLGAELAQPPRQRRRDDRHPRAHEPLPGARAEQSPAATATRATSEEAFLRSFGAGHRGQGGDERVDVARAVTVEDRGELLVDRVGDRERGARQQTQLVIADAEAHFAAGVPEAPAQRRLHPDHRLGHVHA